MPTTLSSIYSDRCYVADGRLIPMFWKPTELDDEPMCWYGDRRSPASAEWQKVVRRIIALALDLEVEVGGYVLKGIAKQLPAADDCLVPLLKSNAADESRHFKGFQFARDRYNAEGDTSELVKAWGELCNTHHPIAVAGYLEAGVFLVSLGILRVVGGPALTKLSMAIAEDEYRHVCTNFAVARGLKAWNITAEVKELVNHTLNWIMLGGFWGDKALTSQNLHRWSTELLTEQYSEEFDNLTWYTTHTPPFEVSNSHLYTYREA